MVDQGTLAKEDEAIRKVLADLEHQIENMVTAGRTVERIKEELATGYISGASTVFQNKVGDWMTRYQKVTGSFEHFMQSTQGANQILNHAEEEARAHAADGIYQGLQGD
ncbi:hypothetical protein [Kitasatospora sp. DSM 101779]|uniref:hypothetical protein n=1 Tax=Kitasatospora sp. DSM 101779 TaxID=2853165 RepID=UPI000BDA31EA|nr:MULTISPECIES: hypothetical protein [Streptomycetaceae]MCU7825975.1 hypothetical protein [Kitasatospora sp. DSM 101779]PBC71101.1 hypothetical protein BX265_5681 [Streptomyces sp. TLI_235]